MKTFKIRKYLELIENKFFSLLEAFLRRPDSLYYLALLIVITSLTLKATDIIIDLSIYNNICHVFFLVYNFFIIISFVLLIIIIIFSFFPYYKLFFINGFNHKTSCLYSVGAGLAVLTSIGAESGMSFTSEDLKVLGQLIFDYVRYHLDAEDIADYLATNGYILNNEQISHLLKAFLVDIKDGLITNVSKKMVELLMWFTDDMQIVIENNIMKSIAQGATPRLVDAAIAITEATLQDLRSVTAPIVETTVHTIAPTVIETVAQNALQTTEDIALPTRERFHEFKAIYRFVKPYVETAATGTATVVTTTFTVANAPYILAGGLLIYGGYRTYCYMKNPAAYKEIQPAFPENNEEETLHSAYEMFYSISFYNLWEIITVILLIIIIILTLLNRYKLKSSNQANNQDISYIYCSSAAAAFIVTLTDQSGNPFKLEDLQTLSSLIFNYILNNLPIEDMSNYLATNGYLLNNDQIYQLLKAFMEDIKNKVFKNVSQNMFDHLCFYYHGMHRFMLENGIQVIQTVSEAALQTITRPVTETTVHAIAQTTVQTVGENAIETVSQNMPTRERFYEFKSVYRFLKPYVQTAATGTVAVVSATFTLSNAPYILTGALIIHGGYRLYSYIQDPASYKEIGTAFPENDQEVCYSPIEYFICFDYRIIFLLLMIICIIFFYFEKRTAHDKFI